MGIFSQSFLLTFGFFDPIFAGRLEDAIQMLIAQQLFPAHEPIQRCQ